MATIIGVRDLKNRAPEIVKRAARGERMVITRYGRAQAMLVPADNDVATSRGSTRMEDWERERRAFEQMLPRLQRRYSGRYVAMHHGRVVGADRDHDALFERVWKKLGRKTFFIGLVGKPIPVVDLPGFVLE